MSLFIIDPMGLFFYTKIGSIISIGDLPTTNIIEPVLTDETVHEVLLKNASVFLEDKKGYIRLEKVRFNRETEQDFILKGTIIDVEFSGVTIHYTIKVSESQILNVTSIDSQAAIRSVGESVDLFITPSDVLQF